MRSLPSIVRSWFVPLLLALCFAGAAWWGTNAIRKPVTSDISRYRQEMTRQIEEQKALHQRDELLDRLNLLVKRVETIVGPLGPKAPTLSEIYSQLYQNFSDTNVNAICIYDRSRSSPIWVVRNSSILVPASENDIDKLLHEPSPDLRRKSTFALHKDYARQFAKEMVGHDPSDDEVNEVLKVYNIQPDLVRGSIYVDMANPLTESTSQPAADQAEAETPRLDRVIKYTRVGAGVFILVSLLAYFLWLRGREARVRAQLAYHANQGLMAERGLTAAVLAHEIRNPLAALRFQLHSLRKNAADANRTTATADTIDSELLRIQQLVKDFLEHERAQTIRSGPVNLGDAVRGLQTLMDELLRSTNIRLVINLPPLPVVVLADPHALRQILMNLVINAQQAMGHEGTITISVGMEGIFGHILINDTGPGIPPEMRNRLFKPFQTSKKEGSGIGLALVKRFVDNFGGNVTVESEPGHGTTFHLTLPLYVEETVHADPTPHTGA